MAIKAPYLPYEKLREVASDFLGKYNSDGMIPVPIEKIVEYDFGIDIVPTPGLHENFDIDSYPTSDLSEFHVDEFFYHSRERRYRFSLAHELAHVLVHRDIFTQLSFRNISEWKQVVQSIPADQYSWIETQAYSLAGLILVPVGVLDERLEEVIATARAAGIDLRNASDIGREAAEGHLATIFNVSRDVIQRRIKKDKLWD